MPESSTPPPSADHHDLWSMILDLIECSRDHEARIQVMEASCRERQAAYERNRSHRYSNIAAITAIISAIAALLAIYYSHFAHVHPAG